MKETDDNSPPPNLVVGVDSEGVATKAAATAARVSEIGSPSSPTAAEAAPAVAESEGSDSVIVDAVRFCLFVCVVAGDSSGVGQITSAKNFRNLESVDKGTKQMNEIIIIIIIIIIPMVNNIDNRRIL